METIDKVKQMIANGVLKQEDAEKYFPELAESEDEKIRKELIKFVKVNIPDEERYIAWLEKQGEQKVSVVDFKAKDWYVSKVDGKIHNMTYNPIDKVEPKFHEGDWVVSPNGVYWHIDAIQNGRYEVTADTGQCGNWPLDTNLYRLWTIKDAKDGDVVCCESGWTCIFKTLVNDETFSSYCFMDNTKWFCETGSECHTLKEEFVKAYNGKIYPATKEQHDTFFAKMKEAGYEWDAEKKELKKIENPTAWSEEDEKILNAAILHIKNETYNYYGGYSSEYIMQWLKSLRPQNRWKPGDEQMKQLGWIAEQNKDNMIGKELVTLYQDLKKLKG